jgi:hypothetical protein
MNDTEENAREKLRNFTKKYEINREQAARGDDVGLDKFIRTLFKQFCYLEFYINE